MIPLIIPAIVALGGLSAYVAKKRLATPTMTPQRTLIFQNALNNSHELGPANLRDLAATFAGEGLIAQANKLEMRARLATLTPEEKKERDAAFRIGLASKDAEAVFALADEFEKTGSDGAADALRKYAAGL